MSFRGLRSFVVAVATAVPLLLVSCAPGSTGGDEEQGQAQRLYVGDSGKVIVLDPVSKSLVTTITVAGAGQLEWLAVRPDGRKLYSSDYAGNKLHIINTDSNTISNSLDIFDHPRGIAFNADGSTAVVARYLSGEYGIVDVIDTGAESVSRSLDAWPDYGVSLAGVDVHPIYNRVYAAGTNGTLYHADLTSGSVSSLDVHYPAPSWNYAFDVEVVPTQAKLYMAGGSTPTISYITTDSGGVPTGGDYDLRDAGPASDNRLRLSWNGQKLYWTNKGSAGPLDEVDQGQPSTTTPIQLSITADAADVVFSADSSKAYALSEIDKKIYVIDTATRTVIDSFAIPGATSPKSLAYSLLP